MGAFTDKILQVRPPQRICRAEPGHKILYLLVDEFDQWVKIARHYDGVETVPCHCEGDCPTRREDFFCRALQLSHIGADKDRWWEPVVLHLTDDAVRSLENHVQRNGIMGTLAGICLRLSRQGSTRTSRICVSEVDRGRVPDVPFYSTRTVLAMRKVKGFAPLFEKRLLAEPVNEDQVVTPARARSEGKPRVPLGQKAP